MKLKQIQLEYFDEIYKDMTLQFPKSELKEYDFLKNIFQSENSSYKIFAAIEENKPAGYCLVYAEEETRVIWLDYLAVFKDFHSLGYGSKILDALKAEFKSFIGMYLEVEKPDEECINTLRRINFYTKAGAKKLECEYFYPNKDDCLAMDLYFIPFACEQLPPRDETLKTINKVFYTLHKDIPHMKTVLEKIII